MKSIGRGVRLTEAAIAVTDARLFSPESNSAVTDMFSVPCDSISTGCMGRGDRAVTSPHRTVSPERVTADAAKQQGRGTDAGSGARGAAITTEPTDGWRVAAVKYADSERAALTAISFSRAVDGARATVAPGTAAAHSGALPWVWEKRTGDCSLESRKSIGSVRSTFTDAILE